MTNCVQQIKACWPIGGWNMY